MAAGLVSNHTLFGIHLVGNDATVDSMGYIIPLHRKGNRSTTNNGSSRVQSLMNMSQSAGFRYGDRGEAKLTLRGHRLQSKMGGPKLTEGDERQVKLNSYVSGVPRALRKDRSSSPGRNYGGEGERE